MKLVFTLALSLLLAGCAEMGVEDDYADGSDDSDDMISAAFQGIILGASGAEMPAMRPDGSAPNMLDTLNAANAAMARKNAQNQAQLEANIRQLQAQAAAQQAERTRADAERAQARANAAARTQMAQAGQANGYGAGTNASQAQAAREAAARQAAERQASERRNAERLAAEQQAAEARRAEQLRQQAEAQRQAELQRQAEQQRQQLQAKRSRFLAQNASGNFSNVGLPPVSASSHPPGSGSLSFPVNHVGGCEANLVETHWNLGTMMGEPTVSGSWGWRGEEGCPAPASAKVWLKLTYGTAWGWVELDPAVPEANRGMGYNSPGSPSWSRLVCSFSGASYTACMDEESARRMWAHGRVTAAVIAW